MESFHFQFRYIYIYAHAKSLQLCPTLCNPMGCSPPGSSVLGILQARVLQWVAMPSSRESSQARDRTHQQSLKLKGESKFLFAELKNELHKHPNTPGSKQTIYFREREVKNPAQTLREGEVPEKAGLTAVSILTSIDLYTFDWLLLLTYIISNQSG